jgi:hypothetical protein
VFQHNFCSLFPFKSFILFVSILTLVQDIVANILYFFTFLVPLFEGFTAVKLDRKSKTQI